MFCLRIPLNLAAIGTIKAELLHSLPEVKSSHRIEAVARGLGFQSNAAMRAVVQQHNNVQVDVLWEPFVTYLTQHGFDANAPHLYRACARVAVEDVLRKFPQLTISGLESGRLQRKADGTRETVEQQRERINNSREELLERGSMDDFLLCLAMLAHVKPRKTINTSHGSYGLKHMAEKFHGTYPDGSALGPGYVTNGAFIAAAVCAGFSVRPIPETPNALFNMSKRDIAEVRYGLMDAY